MGKGGGKSGGKILATVVGAALGFYGVGLGVWGANVGVWAGAMYGASIASTLWSVTAKNQFGMGNFDSDYSQDDYSRFSQVSNDINQDATIPVIYGTRRFGGLQTYSNPYNGDRYLQKDVVICEAGVEGVYNVMANEELITDDTNISIYNIQHKDAKVKRSDKHYLELSAGGKTQSYYLTDVEDNDMQASLLRTVIENIKADAGNGWKIDGTVDDRTTKGINAEDMQWYGGWTNCYVDPEDVTQTGKVVLDNRGYKIGTYKFHQNEPPDNYEETGGYPQLAWIRAYLVASSRLSGSNPTVYADVKGMKCKVWKDNQWVTEFTSNPAWIIRDFLLSKRYGTGYWISEDMIDDDSFKEVAVYCDEEVTYLDAEGVEQKVPRYTLNIILDTKKEPIEHLSSMLAPFGGFLTINRQISLKVEKAETPVYSFDDSTIVKDSVSIGQTALDDTPNRYKIGYFDPSQRWTEVKVVVEDLENQYESNGRIREKTVTLAGCTSQNQALRIGRLYRDLNKVCSLTCSFSVATQGMMLEAGDVIEVTYGGIFTKMPFRITEIEETNAGTYQLTCRQYNASIYNDELGAQITNPDYTNSDSPFVDGSIPNITGLKAKETTWTTVDGNLNIQALAEWDDSYYSYFDHYEVYLSTDNQTYTYYASTFDCNATIKDLQIQKYWIGVRIVTSEGIKGNMAIVAINIQGKDEPPPDVQVLDTDILADDTRRFYWVFEYPTPNDIAGFRIKYNQGNNITWENGQLLHTGLITHQPFETKALRQGIHTVMIKAVDNAGNESKNVCYNVLNIGDLLEENILYKNKLNEDNWSDVVHNGHLDSHGYIISPSMSGFWGDRTSGFWVKKDYSFWNEKFGYFECIFQIIAPASGQFWLDYDIEGSTVIQYRSCGKNKFWKTASRPFWKDNKNSVIWVDDTSIYKPYTGKVLVKAGDCLQVKIYSPSDISEATVLRHLTFIIDVPDREQHFTDLFIPEQGLQLNISYPNYYTTAVRLDNISDLSSNVFKIATITKNPCYVQLFDIDNKPISATVDITWQGFIRELKE